MERSASDAKAEPLPGFVAGELGGVLMLGRVAG